MLPKSKQERRPAVIDGDIARIPIGINGKDGYAIIDANMAEYLSKYLWCLSNGYAVTRITIAKNTYKNVPMHHFVAGKPRTGHEIDHINRDKLDNRINNLREVTHRVNVLNFGMQKNNTSGVRGVVFAKERSKWMARIKVNGKDVFLGYFSELSDARIARKEAEVKYYGIQKLI